MQNLNKWTIIMIVAVVGLVSFLFLPIAAGGGYSISTFQLIQYGAPVGFLDIVGGILAPIAIGVGAYMKNKQICLIGAGVNVVFLFISLIQAEGGIQYLGIGFWLALIAGAANIYLSYKAE